MNQVQMQHVCVACTSHDHTDFVKETQGHQGPAVQLGSLKVTCTAYKLF